MQLALPIRLTSELNMNYVAPEIWNMNVLEEYNITPKREDSKQIIPLVRKLLKRKEV